MSRSIRTLALALILLGATAADGRAGLAITLQNVTVSAGGIGTMDISVMTDNTTNPDTLTDFGIGLKISPVGAASISQFTATQVDPYGNPNYVFAGQSTGADLALPFWSQPYPATQFQSISGGDSDDSGYVTLATTEGTPFSYLATVQFEVPQGASAGDQYQVSLSTDPSFTYFDDANNNKLIIDSVTGGLVTDSAMVPEPPSLALTLVGLAGMVACLAGRLAMRWREPLAIPIPILAEPTHHVLRS